MPTEFLARMPLPARRVFRLAAVMALSLAIAYGVDVTLPYLAPIFALVLTAAPAPPRSVKGLIGLSLAVALIFGTGVTLGPLLVAYPLSAVLIVCVGIFVSNYLTLNLGKGPVATVLVMGLTLVSAAGTQSTALAADVVEALLLGIFIAVLCQWVVYPLFPEDVPSVRNGGPAPSTTMETWRAVRATLVVIPAYLLALTNPSLYLPVIMKSVMLGQQATGVALRDAGRELLGSTLLAGLLAMALWFALGLAVSLWMFTLWTLLAGIFCAACLYGVISSGLPPSFWQNTVITMLILLGAAVEDTVIGKDVFEAFAVRMGLFLAVTVYAWAAVLVIDQLRGWVLRRRVVRGAQGRLA